MRFITFYVNGIVQNMILVIEYMLDATCRLTPYSVNGVCCVRHNRRLAVAAFKIFYYLNAIHHVKCLVLSVFNRVTISILLWPLR